MYVRANMTKTAVVFFVLVLIAVINSSNIQKEGQQPIQPNDGITKQNVESSDPISPPQKAVNINSDSQKLKTVAASPGLPITKEQIDILADQVMSIHGVKPGEENPENLKRAAHLTKVVENVVKNLETKLKETAEEKKLKGTNNGEDKNEKEPIDSIDDNKTGEILEDVHISKPKLVDDVGKETTENQGIDAKVVNIDPESTKNENEQENNGDDRNIEGNQNQDLKENETEDEVTEAGENIVESVKIDVEDPVKSIKTEQKPIEENKETEGTKYDNEEENSKTADVEEVIKEKGDTEEVRNDVDDDKEVETKQVPDEEIEELDENQNKGLEEKQLENNEAEEEASEIEADAVSQVTKEEEDLGTEDIESDDVDNENRNVIVEKDEDYNTKKVNIDICDLEDNDCDKGTRKGQAYLAEHETNKETEDDVVQLESKEEHGYIKSVIDFIYDKYLGQ